MATLTRTHKAYIQPNKVLTYDRFNFKSGQSLIGNMEIVKKMSENGLYTATTAYNKLVNMTSRQRSESGIYYRLSQRKEWGKAVYDLTGAVENKPVLITYSALVAKPSRARSLSFYANTHVIYLEPVIEVPVKWCKGEIMTIHKEVSFIK